MDKMGSWGVYERRRSYMRACSYSRVQLVLEVVKQDQVRNGKMVQ